MTDTEKLIFATKALEFYANKDNWHSTDHSPKTAIGNDAKTTFGGIVIGSAGELARETLLLIKE